MKTKTKVKSKTAAKAPAPAKSQKIPVKIATHPVGSICFSCAKDRGAIAPEPMVVTCWVGTCCVCQQMKNCCSTSDYHWPDGTRAIFD